MSTRLKDVLIFHEIGPQSGAASNTAKLYMDSTNDRLKLANAGTFAADVITRSDVFNATTSGIVPLSGGGTTNFLRADGTWAVPSSGIDGSGATNRIALWSDTDTLTSSTSATFDGTTFNLDGAAVFNEAGADRDFRVEGVSESNLLVTDASANAVGVGIASPGFRLDVRQAQNAQTFINVTNSNSGSSSSAGFRSQADVAGIGAAAHSSTYSSTFGSTGITFANAVVYSCFNADRAVFGSFQSIPFHIMSNFTTGNRFGITVDPSNNVIVGGHGTANEQLQLNGVMSLQETTAPSATAGYGKLYVKSSDSLLYFKTDGGTEYDLTATGGGSIDGSGAATRIAIWSDTDTLTSDTTLTFDTTTETLTVGGPIIGTSSLQIDQDATIDGTVSVGESLSVLEGVIFGVTTLSADTTLSSVHHTVLVSASGAARTITLPAAGSHTGRIYKIKKIDATANTVTIDANGSETIDGATTYVISAQYGSVTVVSDGTNWFIF
jgi:hypothetical protein